MNICRGLCHLIHKLFKALGLAIDGYYINLKFNSIPPCFKDGYPDEARYSIN